MRTVGLMELNLNRFVVAYFGETLYQNASGWDIFDDVGDAVSRAIEIAVKKKAPLDCSVFLDYADEVADRVDELDDLHRRRFRSYLKERPDLALRLEAKGISV